ncbi:MAG: response regulator [Xanthobacteraceae bacterium]|jgi:CheY-like chemotaxis protein
MPRILVVDDDLSVRLATQTLLEQEGYDVVIAGCGREGIEAITKTPFDVVIVDIFMPGMDGLETITAFNRHAPGVPVIAMSGFLFRNSSTPAPDFLSMSTKLGAAFSLHKPFRPRELLEAIEQCLTAAIPTHA